MYLGINPSTEQRLENQSYCVSGLVTLATLILGSLGASGIVLNPNLGWIAVGIGSGKLLLVAATHFRMRDRNWTKVAIDTLIGLSFISIGVVGGLNMVSAQTVGFTMVGLSLAAMAIFCVKCCCQRPTNNTPIRKPTLNQALHQVKNHFESEV